MKLKVLLILTVITLFGFSMFKTCEILGISNRVEQESSDEKEKKSSEKETENCSNTNFFQTTDDLMSKESGGQVMFDGHSIFYNSPGYTVRYDVSSKQESPVISMQMKCITNAGEDVYGVISMLNGNGDMKDYLIRATKTGENSEIFYKTECDNITSVLFDGVDVYYTNESHSIYTVDNNEAVVWKSVNKKADYPYLIGIFDGNIYLTDGTKIESVNINDKGVNTLYGGLCSRSQMPILSGKYIYMFSDFTKSEIIRFDVESGDIQTIVDKAFRKNVNSFTITGGYIFLDCEGTVYYKNTIDEGAPKAYKEFPGIAACDNALFAIKDGKLDFLYINWLIAE